MTVRVVYVDIDEDKHVSMKERDVPVHFVVLERSTKSLVTHVAQAVYREACLACRYGSKNV